jgi:hypothetical protein
VIGLGLLFELVPGLATVIFPVVAPVGITAVRVVALVTFTVVAAVPLKLTVVPPETKFVPEIVTVLPMH